MYHKGIRRRAQGARHKVKEPEFRSQEPGEKAGRLQLAALKKESGVRIQNPGGKNVKTVLPSGYRLLTTGYLSFTI